MTECPTCGRPLGDGAAFCRHCGARVPSPEEPATTTMAAPAGSGTCATCGATLGRDDLFCARCGTRRTSPPAGPSDVPVPDPLSAPTVVVSRAAASPWPGTPGNGGMPPAPPGPPAAPPPSSGSPGGPRGPSGGRHRTAILTGAALVLAAGIAAAVYFGFFFGQNSVGDTVTALDPIIRPVVAAQRETDTALESLSLSPESFAAVIESATRLNDAVTAAHRKAGLAVADGEEAEALREACVAALRAHEDFAAGVTALPADPAALSAAAADETARRAARAAGAYDDLFDRAPALPTVTFSQAARARLRTVAQEAEDVAGQRRELAAFLDSVVSLFPASQSERRDGETTLSQLEGLNIPPDNAAGRMESVAAGLRGAVAQVDSLTPPDDPRAAQIKATYRAAVEHWVTAADEYTSWMWTLHDYYMVSGDWPPPYGIEADTYLDPSYEAAYEAGELALVARQKLAGEVSALASELGGQGGWSASDM